MAMQWRIVKPADLKLGDVVCYNRDDGFPFDDMEVVKIDHGVYLRRPFIHRGEAAYEECYWSMDSDFEFRLLRNSNCTQKSVE